MDSNAASWIILGAIAFVVLVLYFGLRTRLRKFDRTAQSLAEFRAQSLANQNQTNQLLQDILAELRGRK
jgi:hypothetical protein